MAKFGIALGAGPRGLGCESRYSDQNSGDHICGYRNFLRTGIRKAVKKHAGGMFLGRGRIHYSIDAPPCGCVYGVI